MSKETESYTSEELAAMRACGETRTAWARFDALTDQDIDCSDIPELDAGFGECRLSP